MEFIKKNMTIIGVLVAAVLGYYVYSNFFAGGSSAPLLSEVQPSSPVSQELLATLGSLRTIKLDPAIFSDPVFVSLSDFGTVIPPELVGRRNPFAPVGASGGATVPPATPAR